MLLDFIKEIWDCLLFLQCNDVHLFWNKMKCKLKKLCLFLLTYKSSYIQAQSSYSIIRNFPVWRQEECNLIKERLLIFQRFIWVMIIFSIPFFVRPSTHKDLFETLFCWGSITFNSYMRSGFKRFFVTIWQISIYFVYFIV